MAFILNVYILMLNSLVFISLSLFSVHSYSNFQRDLVIVFGDVHEDVESVFKMLEELENKGHRIRAIIGLGDFIHSGIYGRKLIDRLNSILNPVNSFAKKHGIPDVHFILGNHETRAGAEFGDAKYSIMGTKVLKGGAIDTALSENRIGPENSIGENLNDVVKIEIENRLFVLRHYPFSEVSQEHLISRPNSSKPQTSLLPPKRFQKAMDYAKSGKKIEGSVYQAEILFYADTHVPGAVKLQNGTLIANPGALTDGIESRGVRNSLRTDYPKTFGIYNLNSGIFEVIDLAEKLTFQSHLNESPYFKVTSKCIKNMIN